MTNFSSSIAIQGLELDVNLGWTQGERATQQTVVTDVQIHFVAPPRACTTDQLDDTHCYDSLIASIKSHVAAREFRLIEHLGHEVFQLIKQTLPLGTRVQLRLTKKPTIVNLTGGVAFCFGDG